MAKPKKQESAQKVTRSRRPVCVRCDGRGQICNVCGESESAITPKTKQAQQVRLPLTTNPRNRPIYGFWWAAPRPKRLQWKPWQRFGRVHFFRATIGFCRKLDLLRYFIRVNWPEAAALLDKLIDDSLELLFLSVIEHKIVKGRA
jgi:hypothetical protein